MRIVDNLVPARGWSLVTEREAADGRTLFTRQIVAAFGTVDGEAVPLIADGCVLKPPSIEPPDGAVERYLQHDDEVACDCDEPGEEDTNWCSSCGAVTRRNC